MRHVRFALFAFVALLASDPAARTAAAAEDPRAAAGQADRPWISINDVRVNEADGKATFTVRLNRRGDRDVGVLYRTLPVTAKDQRDYRGPRNPSYRTLTIPRGRLSAQVVIPLVDDVVPEPTERFLVQIGARDNSAYVLKKHGSATILDDDPTVSIEDARAEEGEALHFRVRLDKPARKPVIVHVRSAWGTATSPDDGLPFPTPPLTIAPGRTEAVFRWDGIIDDDVCEGEEDMYMELTRVENGGINPNKRRARGVIVDNDAGRQGAKSVGASNVCRPPRIQVQAGQAGEAINEGRTFELSVLLYDADEHRPAVLSYPVSVDYATSDNIHINPGCEDCATATPGSDYAPTSGTLTVAPGENRKVITVSTVDDANCEPQEYLVVLLSNPRGVELAQRNGMLYRVSIAPDAHDCRG